VTKQLPNLVKVVAMADTSATTPLWLPAIPTCKDKGFNTPPDWNDPDHRLINVLGLPHQGRWVPSKGHP